MATGGDQRHASAGRWLIGKLGRAPSFWIGLGTTAVLLRPLIGACGIAGGSLSSMLVGAGVGSFAFAVGSTARGLMQNEQATTRHREISREATIEADLLRALRENGMTGHAAYLARIIAGRDGIQTLCDSPADASVQASRLAETLTREAVARAEEALATQGDEFRSEVLEELRDAARALAEARTSVRAQRLGSGLLLLSDSGELQGGDLAAVTRELVAETGRADGVTLNEPIFGEDDGAVRRMSE